MSEQISFDSWYAALRKTAHSSPETVQVMLPFQNPLASYSQITWHSSDQVTLRARVIKPLFAEKAPAVLMFHDAFSPVRGWHHMTRFIAAGYGVVALENRCVPYDITQGWQQGPQETIIAKMEQDAVSALSVALSLPWVNQIAAWGEGFGGGLALVAAAVAPERIHYAAALNPMPCDFAAILSHDFHSPFYQGITNYFRFSDPERKNEAALLRVLGITDTVHFAKRVVGSVLIGTSGMDTVSPPETQETLLKSLSCETKLLRYPKHAHERINDFEDELLCFLRLILHERSE
jgi:cephalosporin-C deacetylase-like acetyl esterase